MMNYDHMTGAARSLYEEGHVFNAALQFKKAGYPEGGVAQLYRAEEEFDNPAYARIGRILADRWGVEYPGDTYKRMISEGDAYYSSEKEKFSNLENLARERLSSLGRFNGTALDIGSRDGRYTGVLRELGFDSVISIEPDPNEAKKDANEEDVFVGTMQDYLDSTILDPSNLVTAVILNIGPGLPHDEGFIASLVAFLRNSSPDKRRAVVTFAEASTYKAFAEAMNKQGIIRQTRNDEYRDGVPHHIATSWIRIPN